MNLLTILVLATVQGIAELLPVSSSAHVIVAEKLMGLDPTTPQMTLLLVMLHTGTMFAVIAYFWKGWATRYFSSRATLMPFLKDLVVATLLTGVVGLSLQFVIERFVIGGDKAEIEALFGNSFIIAGGLAAVGIMIIVSGRRSIGQAGTTTIGAAKAAWVGAVQGLCLPFRGFSRSGATISTGLLAGITQQRIEDFSFALAVVLTPAVIAKELWRLLKTHALTDGSGVLAQVVPSLVGMVFSFAAGLIALHWLSRWLEKGRWHLFGYYCLVASALVLWFEHVGLT